MYTLGGTYHGLVVEGEALELSESICGGGKLFEYHKRLAPHLHGLHCYNIQYLAKLGKEQVERPFQL